MADTSGPSMPYMVRAVQILLWTQAVIGGLFTLLFAAGVDVLSKDRELTKAEFTLALVAGFSLLLAAKVTSRARWVRLGAVVMAVLFIVVEVVRRGTDVNGRRALCAVCLNFAR